MIDYYKQISILTNIFYWKKKFEIIVIKKFFKVKWKHNQRWLVNQTKSNDRFKWKPFDQDFPHSYTTIKLMNFSSTKHCAKKAEIGITKHYKNFINFERFIN